MPPMTRDPRYSGNPARVHRHGERQSGHVKRVGLAGSDAPRTSGGVVRATGEGLRYLSGLGRTKRSRDRFRARQRLIEDRLIRHIELTPAVGVLNAVQRRGRSVRHTRRKVDPADEPDGARRKRRLIVAEKRAGSRERHRFFVHSGRGAAARQHAEDRSGSIDDRHRHRLVRKGRHCRVQDGGDVACRLRIWAAGDGGCVATGATMQYSATQAPRHHRADRANSTVNLETTAMPTLSVLATQLMRKLAGFNHTQDPHTRRAAEPISCG